MKERSSNLCITYEQPLNERIRTFLRYEQLAERFTYFARQEKPYDSHVALLTLIEIFNLVSRGDLKQELLKQIKRQTDALESLASQPNIDTAKLNGVLVKHKSIYDDLHAIHGQINDHLKNNDFISAIRQRTSIPGGTCDFDVPEYHHWLGQSFRQRNQALMNWIEPFKVVEKGISHSLSLIRQSVQFSKQCAPNGFYDQNLDPNTPCPMIRINVENAYFPECSAGKQRFTIRFLTHASPDETPKQTDGDIDFKLACCRF